MSSQPLLLLAVDTAGACAAAALVRGSALLLARTEETGRPHAESLLPLVESLLAEAGEPLAAVGAFAVAIGPGSFTSLRIGLATVKGLAFGSDRPAVAVSTLAAVALEAQQQLSEGDSSPTPVVAALDARRGEVYGGAYRRAPGDPLRQELLVPDGLYTVAELAELAPLGCVLAGPGAVLCRDAIRARLGSGVDIAPGEPRPSAVSAVARLGAAALARGEGVSAASLVPRYLRRAQAEADRLGEPSEPG